MQNLFKLFLTYSKLILTVVTCMSLNLTNGQVTYDQDTETNGEYSVGTIAAFICSHGYSLSGSDFSVCKTSRSWNQQVPACNLSIENYN